MLFFSSRRRHTRLQGDWSSDVCSSDLNPLASNAGKAHNTPPHGTSWAASNSTGAASRDRKSTRLNSSHLVISYAVFCLKKKKNGLIKAATSICAIYLSSYMTQ